MKTQSKTSVWQFFSQTKSQGKFYRFSFLWKALNDTFIEKKHIRRDSIILTLLKRQSQSEKIDSRAFSFLSTRTTEITRQSISPFSIDQILNQRRVLLLNWLDLFDRVNYRNFIHFKRKTNGVRRENTNSSHRFSHQNENKTNNQWFRRCTNLTQTIDAFIAITSDSLLSKLCELSFLSNFF